MIVGAGQASAHATFLGVDPVDGALLATAPTTVTLTFNEPVGVRDGGVRLLDATGTEQAITVQSIDATVVITPTSLGTGTFIVSWRVISADSHPITGGSTFSVGTPSTQVVAAPTVEADTPVLWVAAGVQALTYLGVLGLAGLTCFELLVLRGRTAPGYPLRRRSAGTFAVCGMLGALLLVPLTALRQSGAALDSVLDRANFSDSPTDGPWLSALLIAAGTAVLWWSAWLPRPPLTVARSATAMAGVGVSLGAQAIVGHTRVFGPPALVLAADLLHVTVGAFWFGGLIALVITLASARRTARLVPVAVGRPAKVHSGVGPSGAPDVLRTRLDTPFGRAAPASMALVLQRFSTAAAILVATLAVTGVLLGWRVLGSFEALFGTPYGVTLLIKLAIVVPVLGIAAWNRYRLLPAVIGAPDAAAGWSRIGITIKLEAALLVAVLAVTGVLVNANPVLPGAEPAPETSTVGPPTATTPPIAMSAPMGTGTVAIVLTPGALGVNALEFRITDAAGAAVEPIAEPTIRVSMPVAEIGPLVRPATRTGAGSYQATLDLPLAGEWEIEIGARTSQFESPIATFPVQVR